MLSAHKLRQGPRQHYSWTTLGLLLDHDRATPELPPDYHRLRTYAQEVTDHTPATGSLSTSKGPQTTTPSSTAVQLQHQRGLSDTAGLAAINLSKFSSTSRSIASGAATNAICSRFLVSLALRSLIALNHACAFSPQVKSPRAETEKPWWGLTINKMATQMVLQGWDRFPLGAKDQDSMSNITQVSVFP